MKSRTKKILFGIVVLVLLGGGGAVYFGLDPIVRRLQPKLLEFASTQLKQPVSAKDIHVSIFPEIPIDLTDLSNGSAAAQSGSVDGIKLKTSIAKLLSTPVGISGITVEKAKFTITRGKDGSLALGDYVFSPGSSAPAAGGPAAESAANPSADSSPGTSSEVAFNLTEGEIEDATVVFIDQSITPNQTITVSGVTMKISNFGAGDSPFSIHASLFGEENINLDGTINMGRRTNGIPAVNANLAVTSLDLDQVLKTLAAYKLSVPGLELKKSLALEGSFNNINQKLIGAATLDLTPAGVIFLPHVRKEPSVPLILKIEAAAEPAFALDSATADITIDDSKFAAQLNTNPADRKIGRLGIKSGKINLATLRRVFTATEPYDLGGTIALDLALPEIGLGERSTPSLATGSIKFNGVSAKVPLGSSDKKTEDGKKPEVRTLPIEAINGDVTFSGSKFSTKGLTIKIAGQLAELALAVNGLPAPDSAFNIKSDKISFEPLARAALGEPPAALIGAGVENLKLSGSYSAKSGNGAADFAFSGGTIANLPVSAAKTNIIISKEQTEIKPSELGIFGGTAKYSGIIRGVETKSLNFELSGSGFALEPITKFGDASRAIYLTGNVNSLQVTAQAADTKAFGQTLHANGTMAAGKGSLEGFNIVGSTIGKIGSIPGLGFAIDGLIPEQSRHILEGNSTGFDSLTAAVSIDGPKTTIRSVDLKHSLYAISGQGAIEGNGDFSFDLQLQLTSGLTSSMAKREPRMGVLLSPLGILEIPVTISRKGGITLVYPDVTRLAKSAVSNAAKATVGRAIDRLAPGFNGAKDTLEGLFK